MTAASTTIGVPSAPYATGAVLAMSERPAAASGVKPRPIRIAAVTATGVPNPAAPSKNAPNENATSRSCSLRSFVMPVMLFCSTSNRPASDVSRYMKMTLSTIQPIGSRPNRAPQTAVLPAIAAGMPKAKIGDGQRDDEAEDRGPVRLDVEESEAAEQHQDRQRGHDRGQVRVAERIVDL